MGRARRPFLRGLAAILRRYFGHNVARDSAALTYYLVFAIFPLMIFLSNLVGIFAVDVRGFLEALGGIVPHDVLGFLEQYLDYVSQESSKTLLTFSLIFTIYFPMRAANALLLSVRKAYDLSERPEHFLSFQLKVLIFTVCLLLTIPVSIVVMLLGRRMLLFIGRYFTLSPQVIRLWTALRFVLLGVVLFFALAILYALAQERRRPNFVWPGVFVALTGWMILSLLFSLYVETAARYSVIYGSIGTIVVLLLWLYLTANMLIMGAEFNSVLREVQNSEEVKPS